MSASTLSPVAQRAGLLVGWLALAGGVVGNGRPVFAQASRPVAFRSFGNVKAVMVNVKRDRSIILTPIMEEGRLVRVRTRIVDHAENDEIIDGFMHVEAGRIVSDDPRIVNACSILGLTPPILKALRENPERPVVSRGQTEVSGTIYETRITHRLLAMASDGSLRVKSVTHSDDDTVNMETVTEVAPDGLPVEALTSGTIDKGLFNLEANLKMVRLPMDRVQVGE